MKKINSIYVVDDCSITLFGIKKILKSTVNYESLNTFVNGKLALDAIKNILATHQNLPDLIFLDINMPIMDGWQFLQEFIALPIKEKIQINIITSSIDSADKNNWQYYKKQTHHTILYTSKPVSKEKIEKVTKIALD